MKIGAGGLESQAVSDSVRVQDIARQKPAAGEALLQGEDLAMRRMRYELNQAVERMRRAAEMYHQPLDFSVKLKGKPKIVARDRRSGTRQELTLEEAAAWLEELTRGRGHNLNGYA